MKKLSIDELNDFPIDGPNIPGFSTELYGLRDESADLIGIVLRDNTDQDFGFVVLTRKGHPKARFASIDHGASLPDEDSADKALRAAMDKARREGTQWE